MSTIRRTPLYTQHEALGAKFVPFAGYEMPVQYEGVVPEHHATRKAAGLFDVSHMGEIFVVGPQAEEALNYLTCNDVSKLYDGKAQYSAITNEQGGVIDDVIVYRINKERFLVCVNASNKEKDFEWLKKENKFEAQIDNVSDDYGQVAIQGPAALDIYAGLQGDPSIRELKPFHFREESLLGHKVLVARTGYTGEDGLEIFTPVDATGDVWQALLEAGAKNGIKPVGLGARDSLRLEACFPLHGHELAEDISAIESGLGWIVKHKKESDFIGKASLRRHKEEGVARKLCGFFVTGKGIVRHGDALVSAQGDQLGVVTSGTKTPTVGKALGLALIKNEFADQQEFFAEVRGRKVACEITSTPFYRRAKA